MSAPKLQRLSHQQQIFEINLKFLKSNKNTTMKETLELFL